MRGKKYSDEIKEQAYALYAVSGNIAEVSKAIGVPANTISTWIKNKPPDKFDELRDEKKRDFIKQASEIIDKGMILLDQRFERALEHEHELDLIIDQVFTADKDEISQKEKERLVQKIRALQLYDVKAITTAIGTLYDKRALAKGESTDNMSVQIKLPEGADEYAG